MTWLTDLLNKLFCFVPRLLMVQSNEAGWRIHPTIKGRMKLTPLESSKWYWLIPLIMEYCIVEIKPQVVDMRIQSVWTADGHDIAVGGAIRYYIRDAVKALLDVQDYDKSIVTVALTKICEFVSKKTLAELKASVGELQKELLVTVKEESRGWGLQIQSVGITDIGSAQNIRLLTNNEINL